MSKKLKPCSFCGGEAVMETVEATPREYWTHCEKCGCVLDSVNDVCFVSEEEAIAAWNTRAERTCHNTDKRRMMFACSACGYVVEYDLYAEEFGYCPNCGAKVVG